ncbi:hypothetical protein ECTOBSL9_1306 [Ectothiorhodospira sp. BSL-9]|nr:hypothetical protein ECTOBSL9_1306 [Ectothiorhodospira sp. BSL-9]
MPGLVADGRCLPSGHAYIIRSSLRITELYPLLGEILFGTRAINKSEDLLSSETDRKSGTNLIAMFIDDERSNLLQALGAEGSNSIQMAGDFVGKVRRQSLPGAYLPELAYWLDTYGEFPENEQPCILFSDENQSEGRNYNTSPKWWSQSIIGAGNPMRTYRFFRQAGQAKTNDDLNVFLLHSLSNLYRNLGLAETAALLKTMLQDIWTQDERQSGNSDMRVADQDGLFFAVLQEGVMEPAQASYLESFFDGIIVLTPYHYGGLRIPRLHVEALPREAELPGARLYLPIWQFNYLRDKGNQDIQSLERETRGELAKESAQGCFVTTFPLPRMSMQKTDSTSSCAAP